MDKSPMDCGRKSEAEQRQQRAHRLQDVGSMTTSTTSTTDIKTFASRHRLKTVVDIDGTTIIPGKHGQIYEVSDTGLATMFMPTAYRPRKFAAIKRAAELAGLVARQVGD